MTKRVIASEKVGYWSDWTPAEQAMYMADDWRGFSRSRGYTDEQIAEYGAWRQMATDAFRAGHKPMRDIADLSLQAAKRNLSLDTRGEIMKSSVLHDWLKEML